ncbi:carboxymuconolactone decarboxylase family protein [Novosphingobium sp. 11B]
MSPDQVREVAPALEQYTQQNLYGQVWKRPGLSSRDRSMVSMAALITRGEAPALGYYANQAIENGVKPSEISEEITHLAFYAGWGRAFAAIGPVREVFAARNVKTSDLPPAVGPLQPLDAAKDASRANGVSQFKGVSAGVVEYTDDLVFRKLWQRPYLSQRDRSLITIAALIADGKGDQLVYHLNRGMDQGLTEAEVGEVLTQLAFYAGWPSVFTALPVVKKVFAQRSPTTSEAPR